MTAKKENHYNIEIIGLAVGGVLGTVTDFLELAEQGIKFGILLCLLAITVFFILYIASKNIIKPVHISIDNATYIKLKLYSIAVFIVGIVVIVAAYISILNGGSFLGNHSETIAEIQNELKRIRTSTDETAENTKLTAINTEEIKKKTKEIEKHSKKTEENTEQLKELSMERKKLGEAIAYNDLSILDLFESNGDPDIDDIKHILGMNLSDSNYVAKQFFKTSINKPSSLNWLEKEFNKGLDVNAFITIEDREGRDIVTSLFWSAVDATNVPAAVWLLKKGANPHGYESIYQSPEAYPRWVWNIEYIAENKHLGKDDRKKLILAMIEAGAIIDDSEKLKNLLEWYDIDVSTTKKHCENGYEIVCDARSTKFRDWCHIFKELAFEYNIKPFVSSETNAFIRPDYLLSVNKDMAMFTSKGEFGEYSQDIIIIDKQKYIATVFYYEYKGCLNDSDYNSFRYNCWKGYNFDFNPNTVKLFDVNYKDLTIKTKSCKETKNH